MIGLATIQATSPLTVRERDGATPIPARLVAGSSYTPTAGDRVVVAILASGLCYVLGGA